MMMINFEIKKMMPLTNKDLESYATIKTDFEKNMQMIKKHRKVSDHCHYTGKCRGAVHSICNLRYSMSKGIPTVFQNGSNYNYHFIMTELEKEFKIFRSNEKNTKKLIKMKKKLQKQYPTNYYLLIV